MSFSNLSADELAKIDAVCFDFECRMRAGETVAIESVVNDYGGPAPETLREELIQVQNEMSRQSEGPFGTGKIRNHSPASAASLSAARPLLETGAMLGPYQVETLIGVGGMGQVFRGRDSRLERSVAIKVLSDDWAEQPDRLERFNREARAVAALQHPNIVSIFDVGSHEGRPYAVMELLEGETVRDRIKTRAMTPADIRTIGVQASEALAAAHSRGIVHRDLKPENLFIQKDGTTKLLDFGLSRIDSDQAKIDSDRTETGIIMGTLGYLSPEQARGAQVTQQADIFSLGCVLYEAFYGARPFAGSTPSESIAAILNNEPALRDPEKEASDPELANVIHVCIEKDLELRIASASEVASILRAGNSELAPAKRRRKRGRSQRPDSQRGFDRRTLARVAGGALLGAGSLAGWQMFAEQFTPMKGIYSIAVLPLTVYGPEDADRDPAMLTRGEELAAALSDELDGRSGLEVRPFHAALDLASSDATKVAETLCVDAVITGKVTISDGVQVIQLSVIPKDLTTNRGFRETFRFKDDVSLMEVSRSAEKLAEVIGQQLSIRNQSTNTEMAYSCFLDGAAHLEPSSIEGLKQSLMCFKAAAKQDVLFSEAYAGVALTHAMLIQRGQGTTASLMELRHYSGEAIKIDPKSARALIANAIVAWQIDGDFDAAGNLFQVALQLLDNQWMVHYQYAYFLAASGEIDLAMKHARRAKTLDPTASTLTICEARLRWWQGDGITALKDALAVLAHEPPNLDARGLAIDIAEQMGYCRLATRLITPVPTSEKERQSMLDKWMDKPCDMQSIAQYRRIRADRISETPYGDYGSKLNQLIFDARRGDKITDVNLRSMFKTSITPWLRLLLAVHPALQELRDLSFTRELLEPTR